MTERIGTDPAITLRDTHHGTANKGLMRSDKRRHLRPDSNRVAKAAARIFYILRGFARRVAVAASGSSGQGCFG
jgi:hypothetical protein